jgi:hypothetical protein
MRQWSMRDGCADPLRARVNPDMLVQRVIRGRGRQFLTGE